MNIYNFVAGMVRNDASKYKSVKAIYLSLSTIYAIVGVFLSILSYYNTYLKPMMIVSVGLALSSVVLFYFWYVSRKILK